MLCLYTQLFASADILKHHKQMNTKMQISKPTQKSEPYNSFQSVSYFKNI